MDLTVRVGDARSHSLADGAGHHELQEVLGALGVQRGVGPVRHQLGLHSFVYYKMYHSLGDAHIAGGNPFVESSDTLRTLVNH